eukprot:superscaffoldBa00005877_g20887
MEVAASERRYGEEERPSLQMRAGQERLAALERRGRETQRLARSQSIGVHAVQACPDIDTFFGFINQRCKLFSASSHRWGISQKVLDCSLHRLSGTRWSACREAMRPMAVRPVAKHFPDVIHALDALATTGNLTNEARSEAQTLQPLCDSIWSPVIPTPSTPFIPLLYPIVPPYTTQTNLQLPFIRRQSTPSSFSSIRIQPTIHSPHQS